jgi:O-antigen/teichoic acid export membrane protein
MSQMDVDRAELNSATETVRPAKVQNRIALRLLAAGTIYGLTNFGLKGINFLLIPIITRLLRPADYGMVALADTIAGPIGMICGLGAATSLRRIYFEYVDDNQLRRAYVGTALRFVMLTCIVGIALSWYIGPHVLKSLDEHFAVPFFPFVAIAICSAALGQVVQTHLSIFQVQNRPGQFAAISIVTFALGAVSVLWLVMWFRMGAFGVLTGRLISVSFAVVITTYVARRFLSAPWNWPSLREHLRLGFTFAFYEVLSLGLVFADRLILQHYRALDEVGIYSIAYTFGSLMLTLTGSLSQAWSPFFFESAHSGNTAQLKRASSALMAGLAAIAIFGTIMAQPVIHIVLDARYSAAAPLVPVILGAYFLNSFYYLFEVVAVQNKRTDIIVIVTVAACVANIGLNLWWVPRWGVWGAALATLAAYLVQAALMFVALGSQVGKLFSYSVMLAKIAIFMGALAVAEWHWSSAARPFAFSGALFAAMALLWPLGLKRIVNVLRTAVA